jgi:hypothetical protein
VDSWDRRIRSDMLFLWHSPVPGVAIAVLGAVAAVMSIRTLSSYEKFFWTLMAFGLLCAEIRAIRVDRIEQAKSALKDRAAQDANFLSLNKKQDAELTGFSGLQESIKTQFQKTSPVQTFGKGGKIEPKAAKTILPPSNPTALTPEPAQPAHSAQLTITQTNDVSTRPDAPYKIKVVIQTTVEMPTLKLLLKCSVPIIDANGGPSNGGMLMNTSNGIVDADHTLYFFQYGGAFPPFGPANPIAVNIWAASPVVCDQAKTF